MKFRRILALAAAAAVFAGTLGHGGDVFAAGFRADSLVEAEYGSVKNTMFVGSSKYSSGGKYLYSKASVVSDASAIDTDDASYIFDIEQDGKYKLFARIYAPSTSANQFYYRWNRESWKNFSALTVGEYFWADLGEVELTAGSRKLELCRKHQNVEIDCLWLSSSTNKEFVPDEPSGVEKMEKLDDSEMTYSQKQTEKCLVTDSGAMFEAEKATLASGMGISKGSDLSGGEAVKCGVSVENRDLPENTAPGVLEFEFEVDKDGKYQIWARMLAPSSSSDSLYSTVNEQKYSQPNLTAGEKYNWYRIQGGVSCKIGEKTTVKLRPRESGWSVDQFIIVSSAAYTPDGMVDKVEIKDVYLTPESPLPPYNPPKGEHPRVYFRSSDIPSLIEKLNHAENSYVKRIFETQVKEAVTVGEVYSEGVLQRIEAKAYYYALFGDREKGREAIDAILQTPDWNMGNKADYTRIYGRAIESIGIIYDWCYDLLSDEEKRSMIDAAISWAGFMEIGWPPNKQQAMVGHGAEAQLLKDDMAFAIAVYDERPDIWNYIGGRFYELYVPERIWSIQSQLHNQGSNYGTYRNRYSAYAWLLITGMGAPEPYSGYYVGTNAYSQMIYMRRPDGMVFLSGDDYNTNVMEYNNGLPETVLVEFACSKDPIVKDELMRVSESAGKSGINISTGDAGTVKWLMFNDPSVKRSSRESLPLSYYFGTPAGNMVARTGWGEGVYSNSVVCEMVLGEYWFGNHQHKDAGNFQLYYKGPLATESGSYVGVSYGSNDHWNYTMQSIAHNTILVYTPNEDAINFTSIAGKKINDGGQRWPQGVSTSSYDKVRNDPDFKRATVMAREIDSKNGLEPNYTYLKGDITNSYSKKVSDFKRSFMFLNFKDETIPAALIVFDKLSVSDPSFEKTWLLHGQQSPEIKTNGRTVWKSNPYVNEKTGEKYTGKMIADSMLPKSDKVSMNVVGGEKDGFTNIRGTDFNHPNKDITAEENTFRLEISPKENSETTYFLNCMQVTDEGNMNYLNPQLIDLNNFYGVKIHNRVVMFSKSGEKVSESIEYESDGGEYEFTICDMEPGTYSVDSDGEKQQFSVTEEGSVLSFTSTGESIVISKENDTAAEPKRIEIQPVTNVCVKYDGKLVGTDTPPETVNGKTMMPVSNLAVKMGLEVTDGFLKRTYYDPEQHTEVVVRPDSDTLEVNGEAVRMSNKTFYRNNELFVELRAFAEAFNAKVFWDNELNTAMIASDKKIIKKTEEGYAKIVSADNDAGEMEAIHHASNVTDGDLSTIWSAQGIGRYLQLELEKETILENIEIIFNPNAKRTPKFEVQTSDDGVKFETVYEGAGSPEANGTDWEVFKFDPTKLIKTKYIRYVSNGSDKSLWAGVKEIRFKEGKEMIVWDMDDEHIPVKAVHSDDGETDADNLPQNLIDSTSRTIWAALGEGRYVDLELESKSTVSGLDIIFNKNKNRTAKFEIQISDDGTNFTEIYEGKSNPDAGEFEWESFSFEKPVSAKYIRYIGLGSDKSKWNGVNEIRIRK